MVEWKIAEEARKSHNRVHEVEWAEAEAAWMAEKAEMKARGSKIREWETTHPKPKKNDLKWKAEGAIPKPKLKAVAVKDTGETSGEEFDLDVSSEDEGEE
jgi:hypothetical protein